MIPVLRVEDLCVRYPGADHLAVDQVYFEIDPGEALGLVGESGSGKSSVARAILGLHTWTGSVQFQGRELVGLKGRELRRLRRDVQMIFQDPYGSLDPRMRIGRQVAEPMLAAKLAPRNEVRARVDALLEDVGLDPVLGDRYPHEVSGGQRQRIAIARALGLDPQLLVCDEATSAVDVSVQAQILQLLDRLRTERGISLLFIAHNLAVVAQLCARVGVMHSGRIVEQGRVEQVFRAPEHPYTKSLVGAVLEPIAATSSGPDHG